jgi:hypothetical protein
MKETLALVSVGVKRIGMVVTTVTLSEDDLATFLTAIAEAAGRMNLRRTGQTLRLVTE